MNTATNAHPGAGHGNGSVRTQYQPACCSPSSPAQISSSTSGPAVSTTPACPSWNSSRATAPTVATAAKRQPARKKGPRAGGRGPFSSPRRHGAVLERSAGGRDRLSLELHAHAHGPAAAVELEVDGVARLLAADDVAQLRNR